MSRGPLLPARCPRPDLGEVRISHESCQRHPLLRDSRIGQAAECLSIATTVELVMSITKCQQPHSISAQTTFRAASQAGPLCCTIGEIYADGQKRKTLVEGKMMA